jgi:transcriptional regulator with XRE-family HTH domain
MAKAPITNEILQLVRGYASEKDISLSEFGRRAGISKAWLSRLKNTDANLSVETATNLLHTVGYDLKVIKKSGSTANIISDKTTIEGVLTSRLKKVVECQNI